MNKLLSRSAKKRIGDGMKIDVQTHYVPIEYFDHMLGRAGYPSVTRTEQGGMSMHYGKGAGYPVIGSMFDAEKRLKDMDAAGVDMHVISLNIPGTDRVEPELGLKLSRLVNEKFAALISRHPDRFVAFASLPMQAPDLALDELRRAADDLGLKGVLVYSNVNGKPLDSEEFWPVYAECARRGLPIFIHPTYPANTNNMDEYCLIPVVGFMFDTTLATLRLIQSGLLEKYPQLKLVLGHLGSTIPYLIGRIDYESGRIPGCNSKISKPPSEYFSQVYIDTVSLHGPSLRAALEYPGIGRILYGSDYPFWDQKKVISTIEKLEISAEEKERIFSSNARTLFNI
jgi:aminocarboxymuconate-semialdehyde decarboxylase